MAPAAVILTDALECLLIRFVTEPDVSRAVELFWDIEKTHAAIRQARKDEARARRVAAGKGDMSARIEVAREFPVNSLFHFDRHGRASCPFHGGKNTQSLHRLPKGNRVYCHVCGKAWNPIDAVMELEGKSFAEAVKSLSAG